MALLTSQRRRITGLRFCEQIAKCLDPYATCYLHPESTLGLEGQIASYCTSSFIKRIDEKSHQSQQLV